MKMSMIKGSLLVVLLLAPLATQLAWAAAADEGKKPEWLFPGFPSFLLPVPFLEIIQCISSLKAYASEILGFIQHRTPISELACDAIRGLPASCTDGLHQLLGIPFDQAIAAICGAAPPPPL